LRYFFRSCLPVTLALAATSCSDQVACPTSVDDYCANSDAPECRYRDYEEALWEWNQQAAATPVGSTLWICGQCGDFDILGVEDSNQRLNITRHFSRGTGQLVTIMKNSACVAGPRRFTTPSCSGTTGRCGYGTPPDGAIDGP
jgi:hypothetical protein